MEKGKDMSENKIIKFIMRMDIVKEMELPSKTRASTKASYKHWNTTELNQTERTMG